jgi:inosose dehydratase
VITEKLSRRSFLQTTGTAAIAAAASNCGNGADNVYGDFRFGVMSFVLGAQSGPQAVATVQAAGLKYIELMPYHSTMLGGGKRDKSIADYHVNSAKWAEMESAFQEHAVTCNGYGAFGFSSDSAENRRVFEWAKKAGIDLFFTASPPEILKTLDPLVEEFDIAVGIHNHGPEARYSTIDQVAEAMQGRHRLIGACIDVGHYVRSGEDPAKAVEVFGDRLYGCHLKDYVHTYDYAGPDWRKNRVDIGEGIVDTPAILKALQKIGYQRIVSLEVVQDTSQPLACLQQSLANLQQMIINL